MAFIDALRLVRIANEISAIKPEQGFIGCDVEMTFHDGKMSTQKLTIHLNRVDIAVSRRVFACFEAPPQLDTQLFENGNRLLRGNTFGVHTVVWMPAEHIAEIATLSFAFCAEGA